MNHLISHVSKVFLRTLLAILVLAPAAHTLAQRSPFPSQPLLSAEATAKPNLLLLMDNSGSMGATYVPDNFRNSYTTTLAATSAYRSPDANRLYYDPRVRYFPRVNASGVSLGNATEQTALTRTQNWYANATAIFYTENCDNPPGGTCDVFLGRPQTTNNSNGTFAATLTFNLCAIRDAAGVCTAISPDFTIPAPANSNTFAASPYPAKSPARTDCVNPLMIPSGAGPLPLLTPDFTRCTWQDERQNALNWSQYYSTRMEASKTSIGIALQNPDFENKFRLGYGWMNQNTSSTREPSATMIRRGVRPFTDNATTAVPNEKTQFYNWLYSLNAQGGTHSNHLLEAAGRYLLRTDNGGPWASSPANDPAVTAGSGVAPLACRRNSAIMFSDGAYSDVTTAPNRPGNVDSGDFTGLNNTAHVNPATGATFTFTTTPSAGATYVTYRDTNAGSMSDRAASWWIRDLRPDLPDILPDDGSGNPAFWQHMTFYTIGLGIRGNITPAQIAAYNSSYVSGSPTAPLPWGAPSDNTTDIDNVDDFAHAGYAGLGKSFSVSSPDQIRDAFVEAISGATQGGGSNAGVAVSDTNNNLATLAGELKYVPSYNIVDSTGNIKAYTLDANGNVVGGANATPTWVASLRIPGVAARNLVTLSSTGPVNLTATTAASYALLPADIRAGLGATGNSDVVNYLRGSTSGTNAAGVNLRIRSSKMGTVVNSPPTYVRGELDMGYTTTIVVNSTSVAGIEKYMPYHKAKNGNSLGVLFSAANDGILHAMNPSTGDEIMGYMPRSALPKLNAFSTEPYNHDFILDGPVNEGDIYDGTNWKSMVFGTGGRGGRYVYAMDVPVLGTPTAALTAPALGASDLKWEINSSTPGFGSLGYVLNPPQSGLLRSGRWVTVFGNGYHSPSNQASLFIADARSGAFIQEIPTGVGTAASPNGLGGVTLVRDKDRLVVAALAGDSQGNMWKFDLRSESAGAVAFGSGIPLFTVPGGRPFSGAPAWRHFDANSILVVAATGILNTTADSTDTGVQTIYGIRDKTPIGADSTSPVGLLTDAMLQLQTTSLVVSATNSVASFYQVSRNTVDYGSKDGWKLEMNFESRQRSIADVLNFDNHTVAISSVVPPAVTTSTTTESCDANTAAIGYVYFLNARTGGNPDTASNSSGRSSGFDVNGDGIGDGMGVAKAAGFPRGNVITSGYIGPRTEAPCIGPTCENPPPCDGSTRSGTLLGSNAGGLGLVSTCGEAGFRRTWRQLLNPPRIN